MEAGSGARQAGSQAGRQAASRQKGERKEEMDGEMGRKGSGGWVSGGGAVGLDLGVSDEEQQKKRRRERFFCSRQRLSANANVKV